MKKLVLIIGSILAINAYADETTSPQPNLNNLQNQISVLQKQVDVLNKQAQEKKMATTNAAAQPKTASPLIKLDTVDPYGLMSKPLFALMPRPGFAYNALKAKKDLDSPIVLGGIAQFDWQAWGGNSIPVAPPAQNVPAYQKGNAIVFNNTTIFATANINEWTTAIIALTTRPPSTNYAVGLDRGIIIFGNLEKSPFYLTLGRNFLPWGLFPGNGFLNNPVSTNSMRPFVNQINQATFSYAAHGWNLDTSVFQNNAYSQSISNYLFNARYTGKTGPFNYSYGAGYISDIRGNGSDAGQAYVLSGSNPTPFAGTRNPAVNTNAVLDYKEVGIFGEYTTTTRSAQFLGQNTGKLSTWILGGAYKPTYKMWGRNVPTFYQINYSATNGMRNVPTSLLGDLNNGFRSYYTGVQHQWMAEATFEIVRNVYVGPEAQLMYLYNGGKTWVTSFDVLAAF